MNVTHACDGVTFSWDAAKAASNLLKHGVSFEDACEAVLDPLVRADEPIERGGELRITATGLSASWHLLRVVFSLNEDFVRIISARAATAQERKRYEAS